MNNLFQDAGDDGMRRILLSFLRWCSAAFLLALLMPTTALALSHDSQIKRGDKPEPQDRVQREKPDDRQDEDDSESNDSQVDPEDTSPRDDSSDESDDTPRRRRRRDSTGRNDREVLAVFGEVVASASASTVNILSDGDKVALGTVIDARGWIMTKASELAEPVVCELADGRSLTAEIVGIDNENDMALLRVEAEDLTSAVWRTSPILLGSWLAVPSPSGDPVSIGVVSVAPREIHPQPGVLGILIEEGELGPLVHEVLPESAAEEAGILVNDIVLKVNETLTQNREELIGTIRQYRPGVELALTILRDGDEIVIEATLGDRTSRPGQNRGEYQDHLGGRLSARRAGFTEVLQHDCILRPRECGGPVVDLNGEVVGINIARAGRVKSYAVPVDLVLQIARELSGGILGPVEPGSDPRLAQFDQQIQQVLQRLDEIQDNREQTQTALARLESAIEAVQQEASQAGSLLDELKDELIQLQQQRDQLAVDIAASMPEEEAMMDEETSNDASEDPTSENSSEQEANPGPPSPYTDGNAL